jgi:hypothetical protein
LPLAAPGDSKNLVLDSVCFAPRAVLQMLLLSELERAATDPI